MLESFRNQFVQNWRLGPDRADQWEPWKHLRYLRFLARGNLKKTAQFGTWCKQGVDLTNLISRGKGGGVDLEITCYCESTGVIKWQQHLHIWTQRDKDEQWVELSHLWLDTADDRARAPEHRGMKAMRLVLFNWLLLAVAPAQGLRVSETGGGLCHGRSKSSDIRLSPRSAPCSLPRASCCTWVWSSQN